LRCCDMVCSFNDRFALYHSQHPRLQAGSRITTSPLLCVRRLLALKFSSLVEHSTISSSQATQQAVTLPFKSCCIQSTRHLVSQRSHHSLYRPHRYLCHLIKAKSSSAHLCCRPTSISSLGTQLADPMCRTSIQTSCPNITSAISVSW